MTSPDLDKSATFGAVATEIDRRRKALRGEREGS